MRPLTSSLCAVLDDADWQDTTSALRALYWAIPESTTVIASLTQWLADPTRQHLFGTTESDELWPHLPQTMPLLVQCLRNQYLARDAAEALGLLGTNATQVVPALIEVCNQGTAGEALMLKFTNRYTAPDEPATMNRSAAFRALGRIGVASPDVLGVIDRGLSDANEDIRFAALRSLAALHQPFTGRLTNTLNTFSARRSIKFQVAHYFNRLGSATQRP